MIVRVRVVLKRTVVSDWRLHYAKYIYSWVQTIYYKTIILFAFLLSNPLVSKGSTLWINSISLQAARRDRFQSFSQSDREWFRWESTPPQKKKITTKTKKENKNKHKKISRENKNWSHCEHYYSRYCFQTYHHPQL